MELSRGALRCLDRLKYYARQSGRAFPFQDTLARDLKRDSRTVRRYIFELVQTGHLQVLKRQHSSAEYVLSDVLSDVLSGDFILTEAKTLKLTSGATPRKPPKIAERIRIDTRFEIGGKVADERLIIRLATLLCDDEGYELFKAQWKRFNRRGRPESWGILVRLAEDVAEARRVG
jgi:Helix-turn-helix domain